MTFVSIEDEDLKVLLFAAGAANAEAVGGPTVVENIQFEEIAGKLPDTVDRVARVWREALRRIDYPERFFPASADELQRMKDLRLNGAGSNFGVDEGLCMGMSRDLLRHGFIEMGVHREQVIWTDGQTVRRESAARRVRLTKRGFDAMIASDAADREARLAVEKYIDPSAVKND